MSLCLDLLFQNGTNHDFQHFTKPYFYTIFFKIKLSDHSNRLLTFCSKPWYSIFYNFFYNAKYIFFQLFQLSTFSILIEFGGQLIFRGMRFIAINFKYKYINYIRACLWPIDKIDNWFCIFCIFFWVCLSKSRKHSDGRQNTSATGWSTLTADRVPDAAGWSTLTADRVLATIAETLQRPTEYPMLQDALLSRATEYLLQLRKYRHGR